jgi:hypothetical protein
MKNLLKKFKKSILASACLLAAVLSVSAQGNYPNATYSPVAMPFPMLTLAGGASTNLANGWTNTTYSTNITVTFTNSTGLFTTNTVITTNNNLTFAQFACSGQQNVGLQFEFCENAGGSTLSNVDFTIAKSVTGVNYDTANQVVVSFFHNVTTNVVAVTNINMQGFGYGRIVKVKNGDASNTLTNQAQYYSVKRQAP